MNKRNYINRSTLFWLLLFTPLIATAAGQGDVSAIAEKQTGQTPPTLSELIYDSSEHFNDINSANLNGLLERIGDSRLVLLGEATHGTAEFYDMRARITRDLIEKKGFNIIAVEADWPDATSINFYIRGTNNKPEFKDKPFSGFPSWMWANHSVMEFTHWLKTYNQRVNSTEGTERFKRSVDFYGLDFYNMYGSIDAVLNYLQEVNPKVADVARWRYSCLKPWTAEPSLYSRVMQFDRYHHCGYEVHAVLQDLHKKRDLYNQTNRQTDEQQRYFNAEQNARLVSNGERYFRTLYYDNNNIRNQRDENMFDTLQAILNYHGQSSRAVVWAHNTHIGDTRATEMGAQGEVNLGQHVREAYGDNAYLIGFGTDHGTVAAATKWGAPMKVVQVRPSHSGSYERLFHDVKTDNFLLPLRNPIQETVRKKLLVKRLQRAIGTTYDPDDELNKHYIYTSLPGQFDEYIWFDKTQAVKPLSRE